jgi:hypothetical protein
MLLERIYKPTSSAFKEKTTALMHNINFLVQMAEACDAAYYKNLNIEPKPLFTWEEREILLKGFKDVRTSEGTRKLAQNLAGFRAVQEAVFHISDASGEDTFDILIGLMTAKVNTEPLNLAMRISHATWSTGADFRGKSLQDNMMVFDLLSDEEKNKDKVQVQAVAKVWLEALLNL